MKRSGYRQCALAILFVVSLFVSSVFSTCICQHHPQEAETVPPASCHEHSAAPAKDASSSSLNDTHSADNEQHLQSEKHLQVSEVSEKLQSAYPAYICCCFETSPRVFVKAETYHPEKHQSEAAETALVEAPRFGKKVVSEQFNFERQFYPSSPFHKLHSGRAPPLQ
jgi:hypothetical protein